MPNQLHLLSPNYSITCHVKSRITVIEALDIKGSFLEGKVCDFLICTIPKPLEYNSLYLIVPCDLEQSIQKKHGISRSSTKRNVIVEFRP